MGNHRFLKARHHTEMILAPNPHMMLVACCLQPVACSLPPVAPVACSLQPAACGLQLVACRTWKPFVYIDVNIVTPYKLFGDLEFLWFPLILIGSWRSSILIDIDQCSHVFIHVHSFSFKLSVFHLGFNGKSEI